MRKRCTIEPIHTFHANRKSMDSGWSSLYYTYVLVKSTRGTTIHPSIHRMKVVVVGLQQLSTSALTRLTCCVRTRTVGRTDRLTYSVGVLELRRRLGSEVEFRFSWKAIVGESWLVLRSVKGWVLCIVVLSCRTPLVDDPVPKPVCPGLLSNSD